MRVRVFDASGNERDLEWAKKKYNIIVNECPRDVDHWELVELHEKVSCAATLTVYVIGERIEKVPAAFYWDDAPDPAPGEWKPRKKVQATNEEGQTGFGMGPGAFYHPQLEHGPHSAWISQPIKGIPSDELDGIGMVGGTNHDHIDPTFEFIKGEEQPEPEPEPGEGRTFHIEATVVIRET